MKMFWIRSVNLLAVAAILLVYQSQAYAREQIALAQEEQQKAVKMQDACKEAMDKMENMQAMGTEEETKSAYGLSDGVYTGTGTGFGGSLTVEVTIENGKIQDISITDTQDDDSYLDKASVLLEQIVDAQGTEGVDAVSGATYSSEGILGAVGDALGEER